MKVEFIDKHKVIFIHFRKGYDRSSSLKTVSDQLAHIGYQIIWVENGEPSSMNIGFFRYLWCRFKGTPLAKP